MAGYNAIQGCHRYGPISIFPARLIEPGKPTKEVYVVTVSGTEPADNQATGIITNKQLARGYDSPAVRNLVHAIEKTVPKGANLVFAGHSQGGMLLQMAAGCPEINRPYNILATSAFGSPQVPLPGRGEFPREGRITRIGSESDLVPMLAGNPVRSYTGTHRIPSSFSFIHPVRAHIDDYTNEKNGGLKAFNILGEKGGPPAELRFNPENRVFWTSPTNSAAPYLPTAHRR